MSAEEIAQAMQQMNARLQQQETLVAQLQADRQQLMIQLQGMSQLQGATPPPTRHGVVDTRVIGKPEQYSGDPMKFADWSFKMRAYLGAVDQRYQTELQTTESSSVAMLNATMTQEQVGLSTQLYYILVMTTSGPALDKCHNAGVNEGFEAWRQFVLEWEPKL
jgi:hypothetical protein